MTDISGDTAAASVNPTSEVGDKVKIRQTRPISKTKNWILTNIIDKSST